MQHFEALECRGVNNSEARKLQKNCYKCAAAWVLDTSMRFSKDVYPGSLSLAHVCLDVIMVGTWMLSGNGRSLSGRYHGWHMDALWERTEFVWTLSWLAHGCSVGTDGVCLDVIMVGMLPPDHTRGGAFSAAKSTKHREYRCGRPVRGAREQHVGAPSQEPSRV